MAKAISHFNSFTTVEINGSSGNLILPHRVLIYTDTGPAILEDNSHADNAIAIDGQAISSDTYGVESAGASSDITVTAHGTVVGAMAGILTSGANESVTNLGTINGRDYGIRSQGESLLVDNAGAIAAGIGIQFTDHGGDIVNRADGIVSGAIGIATATIAGEKVRTVNHGLIGGTDAAYAGTGAGIDVIVNRGKLRGDISLGDGDDVFNTAHGRLNGKVSGGAGSDTYFVSKQSVAIVENMHDAGIDTVRTTISYKLGTGLENLTLLGEADRTGTGNGLDNVLTGNRGDNVLDGRIGADTLDGGTGNDTLTGGAGADTFVFRTGSGRDTITDFSGSEDHIDLHAMKAIKDFTDMMQHHLVEGDGLITITAGSDQIVLQGVTKAQLDHDHFSF